MSAKLIQTLNQLVELQKEQSLKLDKITAILISTQLLTECVDHDGQPRDSEECAEITLEGYSAALCLMSELEQRNKQYQYQKREFFINDEDDESIGEISDSF
jgi:hypothetical protein